MSVLIFSADTKIQSESSAMISFELMHPYNTLNVPQITRPQLKKIRITNSWLSKPILTFNALSKWHEPDINKEFNLISHQGILFQQRSFRLICSLNFEKVVIPYHSMQFSSNRGKSLTCQFQLCSLDNF